MSVRKEDAKRGSVTYSVCVGFPAGEYAHALAAKVLTFKVFCHRE